VAGPESESVWSLFQEEESRGGDQDQDHVQTNVGHGSEDEEIAMQADIEML